MTAVYLSFVAILAVAQMILPQRLGFLPLIIAGCHLGNGEIVSELTPARALILIGLIRAYSGGYFRWTKESPLDRILLFFAVAAVLSAIGHNYNNGNPWTSRAGLAFNVMGGYLYGRAYLPDLKAFQRFAFTVPIVLLPLGVVMSLEKASQTNLYYPLGATSSRTIVREGKVRAQGPFRHPILAGCAGATALPFAFLIWRRRSKILALVGFFACFSVVLACSSSGPLAAVAVTALAAVMWRWRTKLFVLRWIAVAVGLFYWVVKGKGPWYIMASIDLVGGSTGWHRAKLFDQGFHYIGEWWLYGSDYTRHWMASGVSWTGDHVDLTNYYLHLGVIGGMSLTGGLIAMLVTAFRLLGRRMDELRETGDPTELVYWCAGAALAAHAISFVSISYFDQMFIMFYLLLGAIASIALEPVKDMQMAEDGTIDVQATPDSSTSPSDSTQSPLPFNTMAAT